MSAKPYVGNIAYRATREDFTNVFSAVGKVKSSRIIQDRGKEKSRGFGFVEMATPAQAQQAIEQLNGYLLLGRALLVSLAHDDKQQSLRACLSKQNTLSIKE